MDERVLLVEDDAALRAVVELVLKSVGFRLTSVGDGRDALERFGAEQFDLVVLDLMLPSLDGLEICRRIREVSAVPLIIISARDDTADVVAGLELGADDYVSKPFEGPELLARVRAVLRRAAPSPPEDVLVRGRLRIDGPAFTASKDGVALDLSATEFRLLLELARSPGRVLTRDVLLDRVWDYDYLGDSRVVDMAIKRLRGKVEDDPHRPEVITTVRGVGYRLEPS